MPAIELLEGFELLEGIQRGGGYQVKTAAAVAD